MFKILFTDSKKENTASNEYSLINDMTKLNSESVTDIEHVCR